MTNEQFEKVEKIVRDEMVKIETGMNVNDGDKFYHDLGKIWGMTVVLNLMKSAQEICE